MHLSSTNLATSDEPACWGSGELPLLPFWPRLLHGCRLSQFTSSSLKPKSLYLADFCSPNWPQILMHYSVSNSTSSVTEIVIQEVEKRIGQCPDYYYDYPFFPELIGGQNNVESLPLLMSTWKSLDSCGCSSRDSLNTLLSGSYSEALQRIGNLEALLDLAITAVAWSNKSITGQILFRKPVTLNNISDAYRLMRLRAIRQIGLPTNAHNYQLKFADAFGRRLGISEGPKLTLHECGQMLGLTRERIRQISKSSTFDLRKRRWPFNAIFRLLAEQLNSSDAKSFHVKDSDGSSLELEREGLALYLALSGIQENKLQPHRDFETAFRQIGVDLKELQCLCYRHSEKLGFITRSELTHHLQTKYNSISLELCEKTISAIAQHNYLPYDFVYIEQSNRSYFTTWVIELLSLLGPLEFEEIYLACLRHIKYRIPNVVHPPRAVIKSFFAADDRFIVRNGTVGIISPTRFSLDITKTWVYETIRDSTGSVIHKSEIHRLARQAKFNPSTISIYSTYLIFCKPVKQRCVTLTGCFPSDDLIDLACARASAFHSPTTLQAWAVDNSIVEVKVLAGSDFCDVGYLIMDIALARILQPVKFEIRTGDTLYVGKSRWFGNTSTGWAKSLLEAGIVVGDTLLLKFDLRSKVVHLSLDSRVGMD